MPSINGLNISEAALNALMAESLAKAKKQAEARRLSEKPIELRGNNLAIQADESPEIMVVGAAGTGKTVAILHKLNRLMWQYPGARALIVRKVRADLAQTTLVTFERDVLGQDNPICAGVQREYRKVYRYPNGSEIVVGGMDRPGAMLSGEYDFIYPAEAVQFSLEDWETFVQRNRNGVIPFQQVLADTNPDRPDHHLKQRADAGLIKLLNTYHKDNPRYWNAVAGEWTAHGRNYVLGKLERLTGVRRARFLEGKWVIAEGAVYEDWNEAHHWVQPFPIPTDWTRIRSIDFGYVNPFSCSWWAIDPDGRMYLYRQIYKTRRLVEDHAREILRLIEGERIAYTVADHDAEDRATLERHGVKTRPASKSLSVGIQMVQARLRLQEDDKPRLMIFRDALVEVDQELAEKKLPLCTKDEFPGYVWADKKKKEQPVDEDNHGLDELRYAVMEVDGKASRVLRREKSNPFYGG